MGESPASTLTAALETAQNGAEENVLAFLAVLLESTVFVPVKNPFDPMLPKPQVFESTQNCELLELNFEGKQIVPIFSEEHLLNQWSEAKFSYTQLPFSRLLQRLQATTWVHLNPGAEFGKQLSPWELERLQQGREAFDEIVTELKENAEDALQITDYSRSAPPKLLSQLRVILESYPQVSEAFFIGTKSEQSDELAPILGLVCSDVRTIRKTELVKELQETVAPNFQSRELAVIDDLGEESSINRALFREANPFYVAQQSMKARSWWKTLLERFR